MKYDLLLWNSSNLFDVHNLISCIDKIFGENYEMFSTLYIP